jgi:hypothetical protein
VEKPRFILILTLAAFRLFAQPALPTTNHAFAPIANPYSGSWIYYTTDSVSGLGFLNGASISYVMTASNNIVTYVNSVTSGLATTNLALTIGANETNYVIGASNVLAAKIVSATNGLATTNLALALGLNGTNFTLAASNSLSGQLSGKSGTNINYSQITNAPVIPSTNGFVTASITNGLATTNFVQAATNALRTAAYGTILNPITLNHRYTNGNFRAALTIEYFQANGANPAVNGGTGLYTNFNSGEGFNTFNPAANATNTQFATFFLSPNDIILVTNISTGTGVFSVINNVVKTQL